MLDVVEEMDYNALKAKAAQKQEKNTTEQGNRPLSNQLNGKNKDETANKDLYGTGKM